MTDTDKNVSLGWRCPVLATLLCLLLQPACDSTEDEESVQFDVVYESSELIPTVFVARFSADVADVTEAWVDFGLSGDYGTRASAQDAGNGEYEAVLLGMKGSHEYRVRPAVVADGEEWFGEDETIVTGSVPSDLPDLVVTVEAEGQSSAGFYVMSLQSAPAGAVIMDHDGDIVWWHRLVDNDEVLPVGRALLSGDRTRMLYQGYLPMEDEEGYEAHVLHVALDGSEVVEQLTPDGHHDFTQLADGTLAVITEDSQIIEDDKVVGDKIVEYLPDGTQRDVWTVWDLFDYDPAYPGDPGTGWTHSNAIDYYEESDTYLLSVRNQDTLVEIDRSSGELVRVIGGRHSDYELTGDDAMWFDREHQFVLRDDELLVFSNGMDYEAGSRVLGYLLDDTTMEANNHWQYEADPPLYCYTLGDIGRLPSDNLLVTWTTAGQVEEITPDGEVVWQIKAALGAGLGYTTYMESLYPL